MTLAPLAGDSGTGDGERERRREEPPPRTAKIPTGPPSAVEWQDFLGSTVFRLLTEGYLYLVLFRHVDEQDISPRERDMVRLTKEELRDIAAPLATVASKNKLARKHGRTVIASAESYESFLDLFFWMKRVNKIAKRYRKQPTRTPEGEYVEGQVVDNGTVRGTDGSTGESGVGFPDTNGVIFNRGTG